MSEFERWSKIKPLAERFLRYARSFGTDQKLKLIDVLDRDLQGQEYHDLIVALALKGYEINFIEGSSKYKICIGLERLKAHSYFELKESELRKTVEKIKYENRDMTETLVGKLNELDTENKKLKTYKKAGQKAFDNESVVKAIFDSYLSGQSLGSIALNLTNEGVKTKRGGVIWYKSTVKFILQNQEYVGLHYVDNESFTKVQELLKSNR